MKIQLDTTNKTIKLEENVKLAEFIKFLKHILPNQWEDFTLETHTTISYWHDPIVIKPYVDPWWQQPWYYCSTGATNEKMNADIKGNEANYQLKDGVFNLQV